MSARVERDHSDTPFFEARALATGSMASSASGWTFSVGGRAEVDLLRLSIAVAYERGISTTLGFSEVEEGVALAGVGLVAQEHVRLRLLGGADFRSSSAGLAVGPAIGVSGRAGFSFLAVDAAATLTPLPFRRFDARAGLALRGGFVELQGGCRVQLLDTSSSGDLSTLFASNAAAGPYLALGFDL